MIEHSNKSQWLYVSWLFFTQSVWRLRYTTRYHKSLNLMPKVKSVLSSKLLFPFCCHITPWPHRWCINNSNRRYLKGHTLHNTQFVAATDNKRSPTDVVMKAFKVFPTLTTVVLASIPPWPTSTKPKHLLVVKLITRQPLTFIWKEWLDKQRRVIQTYCQVNVVTWGRCAGNQQIFFNSLF